MVLVILLMLRVFPVFSWSWIHVTLAIDTEAELLCFAYHSVENMLKLSFFKWLLNESLLETKWSEVMLIWWFVSMKLIGTFLKFSFLICLLKRFPSQFQLHLKNCLFSIYRYHYGKIILFFLFFFLRKVSSFFFCQFFK